MESSYLWDKSGEPDADIERLEALLAPWRQPAQPKPTRNKSWWMRLAFAACLCALGFLIWQIARPTQMQWNVQSLAGRVDQTRLRSGDWFETSATSRARLDLATTGKLVLEPGSRIRIGTGADHRQTVKLLRGTLHAVIWAPEGEFAVDTPSATAIDLGCIYTVQTDENGDGMVRVEAGWVALEDFGLESFIPGGSVCRMRSKRGPGIPYVETSSTGLRSLIDEFDDNGNLSMLSAGLASATKDDDVTLWHLLRRVPASQRLIVYDRLASLVSLPASITREDAMRDDPRTSDAIWAALGFGDADWWRKWKASGLSR